MNGTWRDYTISADASHHVVQGRPAYRSRFIEVQKFHEPGLAPVRDASGAFHVTLDGHPAYESHYIRTFGFYEGRAAVQSEDGWLHILPDGTRLDSELYAWCGNFREHRCTVRLPDGSYFHIAADGAPAYEERYSYAGDFRDGIAVVQRPDGMHTHIDSSGNHIHGRWFLDLDVYHKGHARACDSLGWHHVDTEGEQLYGRRLRNVEPFYNGQARVEGFDGSLSVINESGENVIELRKQSRSPLEELSGEMVGLWRTQTIRAAVELGVFESLPSPVETIERGLRLAPTLGVRLMSALMEMGLVRRDADGMYHPTDRGSYLERAHPLSLADAAPHWGKESYAAWAGIVDSLRTGMSGFESVYGSSFFDWVRDSPDDLNAYQNAMSIYARHDYRTFAESVDFSVHRSVLDAGGGRGDLVFGLLRSCANLSGIVLDMPEAVAAFDVPEDLNGRCRFVGADIFSKWPVSSDAVILARVLHDWPDPDALRILRRARESMRPNDMLYVLEMLKDEQTGSGSLLDLHMLVMTRGTERTEAQFRELLSQSGFRMLDVVPTESVSSVIRAAAL